MHRRIYLTQMNRAGGSAAEDPRLPDRRGAISRPSSAASPIQIGRASRRPHVAEPIQASRGKLWLSGSLRQMASTSRHASRPLVDTGGRVGLEHEWIEAMW